MTVFLALHEAFKAVPDPEATVKFRQRISPMLKDVPANYSGLRNEYEVRDLFSYTILVVHFLYECNVHLEKENVYYKRVIFTLFKYYSSVFHIKDTSISIKNIDWHKFYKLNS